MSIPHVIFQTSKKPIPNYVIKMIKDTCPDFVYRYYSDNDIFSFFRENRLVDFPDIIDVYKSFSSGAHRADLFRYYYLFINGGIFLDSDAMICTDVSYLTKEYDIFFMSSNENNYIDLGFLGATPGNEIIYKALKNTYTTPNITLKNNYLYFCQHLYNVIQGEKNTFSHKIKPLIVTPNRENIGGDIAKDITNNKTIIAHYYITKIIPPPRDSVNICIYIYLLFLTRTVLLRSNFSTKAGQLLKKKFPKLYSLIRPDPNNSQILLGILTHSFQYTKKLLRSMLIKK